MQGGLTSKNGPLMYWASPSATRAMDPLSKLAMYIHDVHVDDSWFSDHAVLWATFDPIGTREANESGLV